jgi:hypothetical protein
MTVKLTDTSVIIISVVEKMMFTQFFLSFDDDDSLIWGTYKPRVIIAGNIPRAI